MKGTRGGTLSYIWADIPDMHCRRPSVARELVNPMIFSNVYGLIGFGQKLPTLSRRGEGGGPLSQSIKHPDRKKKVFLGHSSDQYTNAYIGTLDR